MTLTQFIPNLAKICAPLRPFLSKNKEYKWEEEHENAFHTIRKGTENHRDRHFKRNNPVRIICDASGEGLRQSYRRRLDGNRGSHHDFQFPLNKSY